MEHQHKIRKSHPTSQITKVVSRTRRFMETSQRKGKTQTRLQQPNENKKKQLKQKNKQKKETTI
jgi:hypothetical protein